MVLERNEAGQVIRATVYDFKTDRVGTEDIAQVLARYSGQMAIYRQAVARLTGLAEVRVRCALVLTALRRLVEVEPLGAD